jgi:glycosyltransferase involved in cell wall biosynthesis
MRPVAFLVPGPLDARTGGTIYDRRIAAALRALGHCVQVVALDAGFPRPTAAALDHAARVLASMDAGTIVVIDSLAFGAMPGLIVRESARLRIVALMHLPLAATVGLDRDTAARFEAGERRALQAAVLIIATGKAALPLLARYPLADERIVIVEPGTDPAPLARGSAPAEARHYDLGHRHHDVGDRRHDVGNGHHDGDQRHDVGYVVSGFSRTTQLLCVGTLNAIKGHDILLEALAAVPSRNWHLTCAGSLTRDPETAHRVRAAITRLGLEARVTLEGDLDQAALAVCYDRADLFVLATRQETYGMAVAEALARGLPIVSTRTGAIPELVGNEAGRLVPVGDTAALTAALTQVLDDAALRAQLAAGARRVRDRLPTWNDAATRMAAALTSLDAHG